MAKSKKKKQFREFESSNWQEDFKERYVSFTQSLLLSERWLNLKPSSRELYQYMKLWSYGKQEFEFSYTLALKIVSSKSTIKTSIDDLVKNGFIEIIKCSKRPGIGTTYKFSSNWYKN